MTLPRKGSRTIKLEDAVYRWKPSVQTETHKLSLVVHADTLPANSTLEVQFWEKHCSVLTPEIVASVIRAAIDQGWNPHSKGKHFIGADSAAKMLNPGT